MIGERDFKFLEDFVQLKEITIGKGIIEDLYDCESTLMYLPKTLTTFRVDSFQFRNTGISNSSSNNDSNKKNIKYKTAFDFSRIRKLVFRQYFPSADQELLYIMNRYTGLDILKIGELSFVSWPSPTFSKSAMKAFLKWVFDLKRCDIRILGVSDENWLMNLRSSWGDLGAEDKRESSFTLGFLNRRTRYQSGAKFHLDFIQRLSDHFRAMQTHLTYGINDDKEELDSRVTKTLIGIEAKVEKFTMKLQKAQSKLGVHINTLLSIVRPNLRIIEIYGG